MSHPLARQYPLRLNLSTASALLHAGKRPIFQGIMGMPYSGMIANSIASA